LINMNRQGDASKNRYPSIIRHEVGGQEAAIILGWATEMAGVRTARV
jgi:hypothetical protein